VAVKNKFRDNDIVVCFESFGSGDLDLPGCARGTRLRGDNPIVKRWPQFFIVDTADPAAERRARAVFYESSGVPPPP
jgi:hypothetical protein